MKKPNKTKPKYMRVIGRFASIKNGCAIDFYSLPMRDMLFLLETDPHVNSYKPAQTTILYYEKGNFIPFRCDFEVQSGLFTEQLLINMGNYSVALCDTLREIYAQRDFEFSVVDKAFIQRKPFLTNAKILYKYARQELFTNDYLAAYRYFTTEPTATIREFKTFLRSENLNPFNVYTMMFHGHLAYDANEPLTDESEIRMAHCVSVPREEDEQW